MILHVLIAMVAGWLQRHQQQVISGYPFKAGQGGVGHVR